VKKLSYGARARQLRTQYAEGICNNSVTLKSLKSRLRTTQDHWKWYYSKAWMRFPIRLPWRYFVLFAR